MEKENHDSYKQINPKDCENHKKEIENLSL